MPLQATSGAASYDAFGGGVPVVPNYIEDVFSTWLYTGTGATQTINNGIDLAGKGGLVWVKIRSQTYYHYLFDTVRGAGYSLNSNDPYQQTYSSNDLTGFTSTGFALGTDGGWHTNKSGETYASWTFREQAKFFDVVTFTGDGTSNRAVSHNLGSVPGCILLKRTDSAASWFVYHRATGGTPQDNILQLNTTDAVATSSGYWGTTPFTDTQFRVSGFGGFNASGGTYVAYLFAHNAGGFGLTGTDNVISCGSYTGNGSATGPVINLGYEPQWVLIKNASAAGFNWILFDNMRGMPVDSADNYLFPNTSDSENSFKLLSTQATGFQLNGTLSITNGSGNSYIYIAIRRGPMKVPTSGTSVFQAALRTGTGATATVTGINFPPDLSILANRTIVNTRNFWDRLRGTGRYLGPNTVGAEENNATTVTSFNMNGISLGADTSNTANYPGSDFVNYYFQRAPGFFDEVCYAGSGVATTQAHNLGVVPELMIIKGRSNTQNWPVYTAAVGASNALILNTTAAAAGNGNFNNTAPTASVFSIGQFAQTNENANTYVAYLFATCAGVSKVGTYTGTGTTQTINCGFTGGARFVLVKRTDSTGNWGVLDTARGMVAGTDPYLNLNTTAAEVNANNVYTTTGGFQLVSSDANFNASGGSYIFLAIA